MKTLYLLAIFSVAITIASPVLAKSSASCANKPIELYNSNVGNRGQGFIWQPTATQNVTLNSSTGIGVQSLPLQQNSKVSIGQVALANTSTGTDTGGNFSVNLAYTDTDLYNNSYACQFTVTFDLSDNGRNCAVETRTNGCQFQVKANAGHSNSDPITVTISK